jgi:hypothetical protein
MRFVHQITDIWAHLTPIPQFSEEDEYNVVFNIPNVDEASETYDLRCYNANNNNSNPNTNIRQCIFKTTLSLENDTSLNKLRGVLSTIN